MNRWMKCLLFVATAAMTLGIAGCGGNNSDTTLYSVNYTPGIFWENDPDNGILYYPAVSGTAPHGGSYRAGDTFKLEDTIEEIAGENGEEEVELKVEGYDFAGWSDGIKTYQPGETYTMPNHNVVFAAQWTLKPDHVHEWDDGQLLEFCTKDAVIVYTCRGCNEQRTETPDPPIGKKGHDMEYHPYQAATATEAGNLDYWFCKRCKDYFRNSDGTSKFEKTLDANGKVIGGGWIIPPTGA